jgi:protocatechuate 3,4-dioxygenase beta subunit
VVSSRQIIACTLLSLSLSVAVCAQAQNGGAKEQTASVSGKVTVKNKSVAGIVVVATDTNDGRGPQQARYRDTTDGEGNYRISRIPAGNYFVSPVAPGLVEKAQSKRMLTIAAGESIRDFDFALVAGGVITGRITDVDGQPLIEEHVDVMPVDIPPQFMPREFIQTDDRGIYRAFGLRPGKYRVSVGQQTTSLPGFAPKQMYSQTFYPSVTETSKAKVIEVTEGSETKDVDIVAAAAVATFTVSGRITDGTGKPVPAVPLGVHQSDESSSRSSTGGVVTNSNGEFKLEDVLPGKYQVFIAPMENSDVRADPVPFEVIDQDLTGLEIKTKKGASLSGMVVMESAYEKPSADMFKGLRVFAWFEGASPDYDSGFRAVQLAADGSFKLIGLAAGNAHLDFTYSNESNGRQFEILQIEQNGVVQPSISIKDGEQVGGVRMVVRQLKLTGAIRGQVKIENGELPPNARIVVWVNFADPARAPRASFPTPEVDSRGRFFLERLPAATYELRAAVFEPGKRFTRDEPKQVITVTDNSVMEVTLTVKLKP